MRKRVFIVLLTLFFLYCVMFPKEMATSTANGLMLWYHNVLPTLLPFSILSYIIIHSNLYHAIFSKLTWITKKSYIEPELLYPLIFGFLCGFPIGAKLMADLYETKHISGHYFTAYTCVCNNFGPAFIISYIGNSQLNGQLPSLMLLIAIYGPSVALFCILLLLDLNKISIFSTQSVSVYNKRPVSRSYMNFKIIDTGIINGFETMLRIAGYIVLFSILSGMISHILKQHSLFQSLVTGLLEVTTGINLLAMAKVSLPITYCLLCGIVSFGGFCGLFQTKSMMKNCPFNTLQYVIIKSCSAAASIGISRILLHLCT